MNSLSTRFLCATLSVVGAAALVALSSPAVTVGGSPANAPINVLAASSVLAHHG